MSVGSPYGCLADLRMGGPVMVCAGLFSVACMCMGVPLAMLQVSQGGAKMVT